jgi:hypothetical protein
MRGQKFQGFDDFVDFSYLNRKIGRQFLSSKNIISYNETGERLKQALLCVLMVWLAPAALWPDSLSGLPELDASADSPVFFLDSWYYKTPQSLAEKPMPQWSAEDKEEAAAFLNRQVLLDGFKAEVIQLGKRDIYLPGFVNQHQTTFETLAACNPELKGRDGKVGQALLVINSKGSLYQAAAQESLAAISRKVGVPAETLALTNHLPADFDLTAGQLLFIPGGQALAASPSMKRWLALRKVMRTPLYGRYTSFVGFRKDPFTGLRRHHNGLDIAAPFNSRVEAAADGKVVEAGWKGGYGKCIIVDHKNGYRTLYGHLNSILVKVGQKVKRLELIGRVGLTGRTTGPHLHFTVWHHNKLDNPLKYLW